MNGYERRQLYQLSPCTQTAALCHNKIWKKYYYKLLIMKTPKQRAIRNILMRLMNLHRVSKKQAKLFSYNYIKLPPNLTIFGIMMENCIKLYEVHLFSTSPNSRQCTTVLNTDVPNCYITL